MNAPAGWLVALLWALNVVVDTAGQLAFKAAAHDAHESDGLRNFGHFVQCTYHNTNVR